jgi:hypothetical protein
MHLNKGKVTTKHMDKPAMLTVSKCIPPLLSILTFKVFVDLVVGKFVHLFI